jgi:hypothetical protein
MRTEEAKKVEVDEANLSKVASLVLKSEDDAVLASELVVADPAHASM